MSKNLLNILRPKLFSRSFPFYRKKDSSDDEPAGGVDEDGEPEEDGDEPDLSKRITKRDRRRLKTTNIFELDYTGEKPVHAWFDGPRIKALANVYQQLQNIHRFTFKIDPKERMTMAKKIIELSEFQYKEIMEEDYFKKKFRENYSKCESEFEGLPLQLKEEIEELKNKDSSDFYDDRTNPITLYFEQMFRVFPPETTKRMKIGSRLLRVASDNLGQGE